jgi:hypothetical protein
LSDLEAVILSLMPLEAFGSTVFEEVDNSSVRLLGAGIATFVRDDFIRQFRNAPTTWPTPELVTRLKRGNSPVLSRQELRDANSDGGLNLFAWHSGLSVGATDEELADKLGISSFAVKTVWREIYDRSSSFFPECNSAHFGREGTAEHRGKQKRHLLLAYLRDHPEEMRPIRQKHVSL